MEKSRVAKFVFVGVSLQMLSMALLFYFNDVIFLAKETSFLITTVVTYVLQFVVNAIWTWRDRKATLKQNLVRIAKFIPIKVIIWAINQKVYVFWDFVVAQYVKPMVFAVQNEQMLLMWERLGLGYQIPGALSVLTIMVINFFIFDRLIFMKAKSHVVV